MTLFRKQPETTQQMILESYIEASLRHKKEAQAKDKTFYAEYHFGMWGVFGTESGFCYETYMDEQEAKERADLKNHAAKGWSIDARPQEEIDNDQD